MLGQLGEQFSLLGFSCQITNQGALGSIRAQLFQLSLHVFHEETVARGKAAVNANGSLEPGPADRTDPPGDEGLWANKRAPTLW